MWRYKKADEVIQNVKFDLISLVWGWLTKTGGPSPPSHLRCECLCKTSSGFQFCLQLNFWINDLVFLLFFVLYLLGYIRIICFNYSEDTIQYTIFLPVAVTYLQWNLLSLTLVLLHIFYLLSIQFNPRDKSLHQLKSWLPIILFISFIYVHRSTDNTFVFVLIYTEFWQSILCVNLARLWCPGMWSYSRLDVALKVFCRRTSHLYSVDFKGDDFWSCARAPSDLWRPYEQKRKTWGSLEKKEFCLKPVTQKFFPSFQPAGRPFGFHICGPDDQVSNSLK